MDSERHPGENEQAKQLSDGHPTTPSTTEQNYGGAVESSPVRQPVLDTSKLDILAEVASRLPYLPTPRSQASQRFEDEDQSGELSNSTLWKKLLQAADEVMEENILVNNIQGKARFEQGPRRGKGNGGPKKHWTPAEDAALITLKSEGLTFEEIQERMPGRAYGAITQRWYRIKQKFDFDLEVRDYYDGGGSDRGEYSTNEEIGAQIG
ncbi:MAG: hypothetical protein M1821_003742 [Bathelium mastoideum]|nr:MAG: hypothetical protein M1821_003742 [Bathelium mastoideum]